MRSQAVWAPAATRLITEQVETDALGRRRIDAWQWHQRVHRELHHWGIALGLQTTALIAATWVFLRIDQRVFEVAGLAGRAGLVIGFLVLQSGVDHLIRLALERHLARRMPHARLSEGDEARSEQDLPINPPVCRWAAVTMKFNHAPEIDT